MYKSPGPGAGTWTWTLLLPREVNLGNCLTPLRVRFSHLQNGYNNSSYPPPLFSLLVCRDYHRTYPTREFILHVPLSASSTRQWGQALDLCPRLSNAVPNTTKCPIRLPYNEVIHKRALCNWQSTIHKYLSITKVPQAQDVKEIMHQRSQAFSDCKSGN